MVKTKKRCRNWVSDLHVNLVVSQFLRVKVGILTDLALRYSLLPFIGSLFFVFFV